MQVFQTWDESSILSTRTREKNESLLSIFLSGVGPREVVLSTRTIFVWKTFYVIIIDNFCEVCYNEGS